MQWARGGLLRADNLSCRRLEEQRNRAVTHSTRLPAAASAFTPAKTTRNLADRMPAVCVFMCLCVLKGMPHPPTVLCQEGAVGDVLAVSERRSAISVCLFLHD